MPLATTNVLLCADGNAPPVIPIQCVSGWKDVGLPTTVDAASITNPTTQIVNDSNALIVRERGVEGTNLIVRLKYPAATTPTTDPKIAVYGRKESGDPWMRLRNPSDERQITLVTASTTDTTDGTWKYTATQRLLHTFDMQGCREFLIGTETAFAGSGTPSTSKYQVKFF